MSEKTEKPTAKRLKDARKKGLIAFSKELNTVSLLFGLLLFMIISIKYVAFSLKNFLLKCISGIAEIIYEVKLLSILQDGFLLLFVLALPIMLFLMLLVVGGSIIQTGFNINLALLSARIERVSIIKGFKRMFSLKSVAETIKSSAKVAICCIIFIHILGKYFKRIILMINLRIEMLSLMLKKVSVELLMKVVFVFLAVALIDLIYQRWDYLKRLKMSKGELKQEIKEEEGDPIVSSRRKQLHDEIAFSNIVEDVIRANVIVVNPCQIAVALHYQRYVMNAPVVVAKGVFHMARRIKEVALKHNKPIVENVQLAHELIKVEIGDEIPEKLYDAVAEIYKIIYELMGHL